MTLMRPPATPTVEQDAALSNLLESLLAEVPPANADVPAPPAAQPRVAPPVVETPPVDAPAPTLNEPTEQPLTKETQAEPPADSEIPAWVGGGFRTLLFRIGEFRFGVPLVLMHSVCPYPDDVTRVPGQPHWHRGVFRYRDASTVVADLGGVIGVAAAADDPKYLLVLGEGRKAIAIDAIVDTLVLHADQVRWHKAAGREWLLGLLPDQMCGLLDANALSSGIRHR
ncbi:chemotaxis protein CheW [Thiosocius teredinicola]|uniref:chemotaxis protein CheW n=1 Tax=Thiosocius teredinicola TaxID=1973002 RepID=UPI000990DDA4